MTSFHSNKLNLFKNVKTVVINLLTRQDKRDYIQKHLNERKIKFSFYDAIKNTTNPKRGCLESHLAVIRGAIAEGVKYLLLMEDDCFFIRGFQSMKEPPDDWDMIYLGGTVFRTLNKIKGYSRVQCWTTHGYFINLENKTLVAEIMKMTDFDMEIDTFYLEKIHPIFNCYMCNPMIAIQKEGFSDIENREVSYNFMEYTLDGLRTPEHHINEEGHYVLHLNDTTDADLPYVSIITPTYKRRALFSIALRNFNSFIYPKHKLEWIIVDDSPEDYARVEDILPPRDKRINYIYMPRDTPMTIAMKRNIAVANSKYEYIVSMDDDDYYCPESIIARIKVLLRYKKDGIECVGTSVLGTYHLLKNESSMSSDGPISLSEASMAYTRKFWEERPFDELCIRGEHKSFTEGRLHKIMDIPYSFILIAMNHRQNFTENREAKNLLTYKETGDVANFFDTWDEDTQLFMLEVRAYLIKSGL